MRHFGKLNAHLYVGQKKLPSTDLLTKLQYGNKVLIQSAIAHDIEKLYKILIYISL